MIQHSKGFGAEDEPKPEGNGDGGGVPLLSEDSRTDEIRFAVRCILSDWVKGDALKGALDTLSYLSKNSPDPRARVNAGVGLVNAMGHIARIMEFEDKAKRLDEGKATENHDHNHYVVQAPKVLERLD